MISAADACTLLRVVLAPVFVSTLAAAGGRPSFLPVAVCAVAMASDFADGRLARRFGSASAFGRLFDHGADALFLFPGLAALAALGLVPALLPVAATVAFALYVVDGWRRGGGRRVALSPSRTGAFAGVANYGVAAVGALAVGLRVPHLDPAVHAGATIAALMNVAAAADRVCTIVRESRPAAA